MRADALLWRQDSIIEWNVMSRLQGPDHFTDRVKFDQLRVAALTAQRSHDMREMRRVLSELISIEKPNSLNGAEKMMEQVNVIRK